MNKILYDANGDVAIIPVEGFAEGEKVTVGKGKKVWRIHTIGRQLITLRPTEGRLSLVLYVRNDQAEARMRKVEA